MDDLEALITDFIVDVAELPDRTSPEDQPDMMLIDHEELAILLNEFAEKCIEAQAAEIADLRAQAERDWVTPLLKWTVYGQLFLGGVRVGCTRRDVEGRRWLSEPATGGFKGHATEDEARAAVESAVRKALGVKPPPAIDKDAHMDCYQYGTVTSEPARTCKTCLYTGQPARSRCRICLQMGYLVNWTPKTA